MGNFGLGIPVFYEQGLGIGVAVVQFCAAKKRLALGQLHGRLALQIRYNRRHDQ